VSYPRLLSTRYWDWLSGLSNVPLYELETMTDKQENSIAELRDELHAALSVEKRLSRLEGTQYLIVALMVAVAIRVYLP
jgi:hypothetical protein